MPNYRKLTQRLAELYPTIPDSQLILRYSNVKTTGIAFSAAAELNWIAIIDYAHPRGLLLQIIQTVIDREDDDSIMQYALEETEVKPMKNAAKVFQDTVAKSGGQFKKSLQQLLIKGKFEDVLEQLAESAQLLDSDDYTNNIVHTQSRVYDLNKRQNLGTISEENYSIAKNKLRNTVTYLIDQLDEEKEVKLLIQGISASKIKADTGTGLNILESGEFEKIMNKHKEIMPISWLYNAIDQSKIVCKIELTDGSTGSGFLLKGGYVMTNHHVVCKYFPKHLTDCKLECLDYFDCPKRLRILMNYRAGQESISYDLDPANGYYVNIKLDYALIKIKDRQDHPISDWGHAIFQTFKQPQIDNLVNIIQHPNGDLKKIAMPDSVLSVWPEENYLFYLANTDSGASGSPVFNQDWEVIALHHVGVNEEDGGLQINAAGDVKAANRGILIGAILDDLKLKGLEIN